MNSFICLSLQKGVHYSLISIDFLDTNLKVQTAVGRSKSSL